MGSTYVFEQFLYPLQKMSRSSRTKLSTLTKLGDLTVLEFRTRLSDTIPGNLAAVAEFGEPLVVQVRV